MKPRTVRTLTPVEAAWIGALVEGEGSITRRGLAVENTDVEVIATLLRVTGAGSVSYRKPGLNKLGRKPSWAWQLGRVNDLLPLLIQLEPYCMKAQRAFAGMLGPSFVGG